MSRGNYHLTIATTPEAPTRDDVTASRGRREGGRKNQHRIMTAGPFLNLANPKLQVRVAFSSLWL